MFLASPTAWAGVISAKCNLHGGFVSVREVRRCICLASGSSTEDMQPFTQHIAENVPSLINSDSEVHQLVPKTAYLSDGCAVPILPRGSTDRALLIITSAVSIGIQLVWAAFGRGCPRANFEFFPSLKQLSVCTRAVPFPEYDEEDHRLFLLAHMHCWRGW